MFQNHRKRKERSVFSGCIQACNTRKSIYSGFTDNLDLKIAAVHFFQKGINTTERVTRNNSEKLWRIFRSDDSPTALYVDQNTLILIKRQWDIEALLASIERLEKSCAAASITFCAGVSDGRAGLMRVPELFYQAKAALLHADVEGNRITEYKDIGLDKLICAASSSVLKEYVEHTVDEIIRYDEKNGSDLCMLLRCYTENNGSVSNVARQLGVHRNTVNYQIGRIKKLFSLTLSETEKAELTLAFRILKLNEKGQLL